MSRFCARREQVGLESSYAVRRATATTRSLGGGDRRPAYQFTSNVRTHRAMSVTYCSSRRPGLGSAGNRPPTRIPCDFCDAQGGYPVLARRRGERVVNVVRAVIVHDDGVVPGGTPA